MELFPISNRGKIFHREISIGSKPQYERILIDKLPKNLTQIITSCLDAGINQITPQSSRKEIEQLASQTSNEIHHRLPFNFYESSKDFYDNGSKQELFNQEYFFSEKNAIPHKLSELFQDDMVNCIAQSIAIKEVLHSQEWGMYALFSHNKEGGHHILAKIQGDYCIRIDGSSGPERERIEKENKEIYSFNKKDFYRRYQRTSHLDQRNLIPKNQIHKIYK